MTETQREISQFAVGPQCAPCRDRDAEWFCASCAKGRPARARIPLERNRIAVRAGYQSGPLARLAAHGDGQAGVQAFGHPGRGGWDGRRSCHRSELLLIR